MSKDVILKPALCSGVILQFAREVHYICMFSVVDIPVTHRDAIIKKKKTKEKLHKIIKTHPANLHQHRYTDYRKLSAAETKRTAS